jgi:hypothetical protein
MARLNLWTVLLVASTVLLGGSLPGCGYSTESSLDPQYQTIFVEAFYDQSKQYDLQAPLTNAIIRKFITDTRLEVVQKDQADLLLQGAITNYRLEGLTLDEKDETTQFLTIITAAVRLTDQNTGEILWEDPSMAGETTYYPRASGLSADRMRGNAETFLNAVRSFNTAEENRAASEALEQLASDIFYRTIEPF